MPSKIVIPRRIYVPALIVAVLLIALVIGSLPIRAQDLVEYPILPVCWRADGVVRVVESEDDCRSNEKAGTLLTEGALTDLIGPVIVDLQNQLDALEAQLDDCCEPPQ